MKYLLVLLFTFSICQAQTIKDERLINWTYGKGNNDVSILFKNFSTLETRSLGEYKGEYKYQILPQKNNDAIDSSAQYGEVTIYAFRDLAGWNCVRDQMLRQKSKSLLLLPIYHATTNPTRQDIINFISLIGFESSMTEPPEGLNIGIDQKIKSYSYIVPGSFVLTAGALIVTDDGNGNLIGNVGAGVNKINYGYNSKASINVTFSSTVLRTTAITASYSIKYFPHNPYDGFLRFKDLPAKSFTFLFIDKKGYKINGNYSVQPKKSLEIIQESNFTYTNQLITLQ